MLRLVMMGTGTFAEPTFEAILQTRPHEVVGLVTQPDRASGVARGSTRQVGIGMKAIAEAAGVPFYNPESINTDEGLAVLRSWQPDLLVVAAYGQILKAEILQTARLGGINVHASLLPKYRGAAPVAWAIAAGETVTGVTIIRMSVGLDAGDILAKIALDILPDETAGELETRLGPIGATLAVDVIHRLAVGIVAGQPQDKAAVTKAPKLTKEHGLIPWNRSATAVSAWIRAMQPWPTAYTFLHRPATLPLRALIVQTRPDDTPTALAPGTLEQIGKRLFVATAAGRVEVLTLQPAGKKAMTAAEFLRGRPIKPGDRFGAE